MNTVIENLYDEPTQTVESVIARCTRVIERDAMVAGAGRRVRNPMLTIFLGRDAIDHIREIQETYFSCWSDYVRKLKILKNEYTQQEIESAIIQSTRTQDNFYDERTIRVAWFWDIMDPDFDRHFACVRQNFSTPIGLTCRKTVFVFCSQSTTVNQKITQARLQDVLIPWAQENGNHLIVLSDATGKGPLKAAGIAENYRLAANLLLILNSTYPTGTRDLGKDMDFALENEAVWSASYRACRMNSYDIVGVSLRRILEKYLLISQRPVSHATSAEELICGEGKGYVDFLDEMFRDVALKHCPDDFSFWNDIPFTETIAKYEQKISGAGGSKGGFFGKLFGGKNRDVQPEEAIESLSDFWKCTVEYYYLNPIQQWMNSPEGMQEVLDYIYGRMTSVLNTATMKSMLQAECQKALGLIDSLEYRIARPNVENYQSVPMVFHEYAVYVVKLQIYGTLLKWLSDAMRNLSKNASGFEDLLRMVMNTLKESEMEASVVTAYGNHMESLIEDNIEILNQCIRPCEKESELLQQLERAFVTLVDRDTRNVYHMSLQENLEFLIRNGSASSAINVIADCFKYNIVDAGRLPIINVPTGTMFCIMNDAMNGLIEDINQEAIGNQFIVNRSDRIERLFLYSVEPKYIRYSND